jgi:GDPmannose 4,6-dehydratase
VTDAASVLKVIGEIQPDEIYNLAAQSRVPLSFELPEYTTQANAVGALNILEAIRFLGLVDQTKFYQASSSELYGLVQETPQTETTPFYPRSPYAVAKLYAYWATVNYREAFGMFACNGILFNHESPLRGEHFVTRKVTLGACRYKLGLQEVLYLGNLDAKRDWGYAKDYVEAIWLIMQQDKPDDFVIASGENHSVREFVELAFKELGIKIEWRGKGIDEHGVDQGTGKTIIAIDPRHYRPTDVECLLGNAEKAKNKFHWTPKTNFRDLVSLMVEADYEMLSKGSYTNCISTKVGAP